jgi:hypothetical protein
MVTGLFRYPVKGLSPDPLQHVAVTPGEALPFDRAWAIENGPGRFDAASPQHLPKINFLMLMRDEKLATLETRFDEATQRLTILRGGKTVAAGVLPDPTGRRLIEQFLAAYMSASLRGAPKIVSAPGHSFSDVAAKRLHFVNLASVRDLERAMGRPVDPLRFRPNLVFDGFPAWAEFTWIGHNVTVGGVSLKIWKRTDRCAATNVDPKTGVRDLDIPAVLRREWGHVDFGVYAEVQTPGTLNVGDTLTPAPVAL